MPFISARDRDAWHVIRGYLYQIQHTVERWLTLGADEVLELETGEDIDVVTRSCPVGNTDPQEIGRVLSQVKHREAALTLKSADATTALANFVEHRKANPTSHLLFLYLTNASTGREKLSPFLDGTHGVDAWNALRPAPVPGETLDAIRKLLNEASRPDKLPDDTWDAYQSFLSSSTDADLLDLIASFEWSVDARDCDDLQARIQTLLSDLGLADTDLAARAQYERLVVFVFRMLSQRGLKQLSQELLSEQLRLPALTAEDRACLSALQASVSEHDEKFAVLEGRIQELAEQQRVAIPVAPQSAPVLSLPPPVRVRTRRDRVVSQLALDLSAHAWLWLHGGVGVGKTQLVLLLLEACGGEATWLRLRGDDYDAACLKLDQLHHTILRGTGARDQTESVPNSVHHWLPRMPVVIDDLPDLWNRGDFTDRILILARLIVGAGSPFIMAAHRAAPGALAERSAIQPYSVPVPALSDEEIIDLLAEFNAPQWLLDPKRITFFRGVTGGHPMRLAALMGYLKAAEWTFGEEQIEAVFHGEFEARLQEETVRRLLETIPEPGSRELLWRLKLPWGQFQNDDVGILAQVEPSVARPQEALSSLLDIWVQRETDTLMSVSPLLQSIRTPGLPPNTTRWCHLALAEKFLKRTKLDHFEGTEAIYHLVAADDAPRAAVFLLQALNQLQSHDEPMPRSPLLSVWWEAPIPDEVDLGLRIAIRSIQVRLARGHDKPVEVVARQLDELLDQVPAEGSWALLGAAVLAVPEVSREFPEYAFKWTRLALSHPGGMHLPDGTELALPEGAIPDEFVFFPAVSLRNTPLVAAWLDLLAALPTERRVAVFAGQSGEQASTIVADGLWMAEADKPTGSRDWTAVLAALSDLRLRAFELHLPLLAAAAARGRVIVLAEYLHDIRRAVVEVEQALAVPSDDPRVGFLLTERLGANLCYAHRDADARPWLQRAKGYATEAYPLWRVEVLLHLGRVYLTEDPPVARQCFEQALAIAEEYLPPPLLEIPKVYGEMALFEWQSGSLQAAADRLSDGARVLLECREDTTKWRKMFVLYGHVSGYLAGLASTGQPPQLTSDGEEYATPQLGMFISASDQAAAIYSREKEALLPMELAMLAEATGRDDSALEWARTGIELAGESPLPLARIALTAQLLPTFLVADAYEDALDAALDHATLAAAYAQLPAQEGAFLGIDLDPGSILGDKPNELWNYVEHGAAIEALLPAAFRIATLHLSYPVGAAELAQTLIALCKVVSGNASDTALWTSAATILDESFLGRVGFAQLAEQAGTLAQEGRLPLAVLAYLGGTIQKDAAPQQSLAAHLNILPYVHWQLRPGAIYRRVITPFVCAFWPAVFEAAPFHFRTPRLTRGALSSAITLPDDVRAQGVLWAVLKGLGVRLPAQAETELNDWLSGKPPEGPIGWLAASRPHR